MKGIITVLLAVVVFMITAAWTPASASPFDDLKKTYSGIDTLEAKFQQKLYIAGLNKEREFTGDFFYKRQKGFLWSYSRPRDKYFLYDGKYIWQGEAGKAIIVKEKVVKEKTRGSFLDLIEDIAKLDELFTLKQQTKMGDLEMIEMQPKNDSTIKSARVWIDGRNLVRKIELQEFTGNVNRLEFSSIKVNQRFDEGKLVFKQPPGTQIVER